MYLRGIYKGDTNVIQSKLNEVFNEFSQIDGNPQLSEVEAELAAKLLDEYNRQLLYIGNGISACELDDILTNKDSEINAVSSKKTSSNIFKLFVSFNPGSIKIYSGNVYDGPGRFRKVDQLAQRMMFVLNNNRECMLVMNQPEEKELDSNNKTIYINAGELYDKLKPLIDFSIPQDTREKSKQIVDFFNKFQELTDITPGEINEGVIIGPHTVGNISNILRQLNDLDY